MLPKADIDQWLKILKKKLPKERIVKFSSLKKTDYKKIVHYYQINSIFHLHKSRRIALASFCFLYTLL